MDSLRRKLAEMMANPGKAKPYYCEVEYIQSTGTQYIDTGVNAKSTLKTDIYFEVVDKTQGGHIFGGRTVTSGGRGYGVYLPTSGGIGFDYETRLSTNVSPTNGYRYRVVKDGASNILYVNDVQSYTGTNTAATFDLNVNMALFYMKDSNTSFNASVKCKVFYFKIWNNAKLVRDYIPVLDWNYIPCLYDKVSGELFYNQGTGDFLCGREIHYVEYIESTGTQYIDTGVTLTNNHSVEIDYQLTAASQNRKGLYGGLVPGGGSMGPRHGALLSPSNQYLEAGYGSTNVYYQLGMPDTNRHVLKQAKNELYFDNVLTYTFTAATFTQDFTSPLGNFNYTNYNPASAKYYSSKWWDGATLIRDYKPAIDENGLAYWFDRVMHVCYLNAGTGVFNYPARKLNYLESTGTQYINTNILPTQLTKAQLDVQFTDVNYKQSVLGSNNGASGDTGWNNLFGTNENSSTSKPTYFWCQWGQSFDGPVTKDTNRHLHTFERNGNLSWTYTVDNTSKTVTSGIATQTNPKVLYLFACNNNGTLYRQAKVKVYYCKIWNLNSLVCDYIPAFKDGVAGMYDKANNVFYQNSGTGNFVIGKIIESHYF